MYKKHPKHYAKMMTAVNSMLHLSVQHRVHQDKFECMKANNVMILTGEAIRPIIDVVEQNHGKEFIKKFAIKK